MLMCVRGIACLAKQHIAGS